MSKEKYIHIKGARVHNLKNIDVQIRHNELVVITGLSGSGKSSLAFDTLYAEGQRRYVESLSAYARQFMGKIEKPDVDSITGISPAVAVEQKVNTRNPRSTVGTSTEIYDYLKLLYARIGTTYSPVSGNEVKRHTVNDVLAHLETFPDGEKILLLAPRLPQAGRNLKQELELLKQQGYSRLFINGEVVSMDDCKLEKLSGKIHLLIDRFVWKSGDDDNISRIADSIETAFHESGGSCVIEIHEQPEKRQVFSNVYGLDGILFEEPSVHFFSFNNPLGACKTCDGYGSVIGIDEDLVIPDKQRPVYDEAVVCWKGEKMQEWKEAFMKEALKSNFPIHKPYADLNKAQKSLLWNGNGNCYGINDFFKYVEEKSYKIQYRVMLSRYRGKTTCPDCRGTRLRSDADYVKIQEKSIIDLVLMPVDELLIFFRQISISSYQKQVAKRLLEEITNRLLYLSKVGLGYLTLNRLSSTLSGGESQRINLATSLGSSLVGSMYILDEPSIGLHPRDTRQLIEVLRELRNAGNTVVVVEHDEEIMLAANTLIDMGPMAGTQGGEIVFQGTHKQLLHASNSLTAQYLSGKEHIAIPETRRKWKESIVLKNCTHNNLKGIDVSFPLFALTVVTGVSGSGKSSLVKGILLPALKKMYEGYAEKTGAFSALEGSYRLLQGVEFIDQNPIGKSSRSNPVTYLKAYDEIRELYARQPLSKMRGYKPAYFSFNVDGGRCETCQGDGFVTIEMQFMSDMHLLCDACNGKRFKEEMLEVYYKEKNIADILEMTVDDAIAFFSGIEKEDPFWAFGKKIIEKIQPLQDVGLGYICLGQSSSTLSGGEAQRIKLASYLNKKETAAHLLFIFDEPTTGLHFHDIQKLLYALNELIQKGHSVLVIEHNPDVIKCADWVIDLGPEGGDKGGELVFSGTPEDLVKCKKSYTGRYLLDKLSQASIDRVK